MSRVPDTGRELREREKLIARLKDRLAYFRGIPEKQREAECADDGERDCIALLRENGVDAS